MKFFGILTLLALVGFLNLRGMKNEKVDEEGPKRNAVVFCAPAFDPAKIDAKDAPLFDDPGTINYPVSTVSGLAQKYFNQGLTMLYAFNHGEAGRSFKAAMEYDSTMAMAYWGLAMVLGPNYNAALNPSSLSEINEAIDRAVKFSRIASEKERMLIDALAQRFPRQEVEDMTPYNAAYARAMKRVHEAFPSDAEIAATYADALMNEHPWNLWLKDGTSQPWTADVMQALETMLTKWPDHPALCHLYIHATEASKFPEKALPQADKLGDLMPFAGHIVHMPSHTYIRTGDYHKAVIVNEKAISMDSTYIAQCKVAGAVPMYYYPHNIHFLAVSAFLEGSSAKAIDAAWMIQRNASKEFLDENATIQHYYSIPFYVLVHLGKWDDILAMKYPGEQLKYPAAIWHYARGMAYAAKGNLEKAGNELWAVEQIAADESLQKLLIWESNSASQLVTIAKQVLKGEIEATKGNYDDAFTAFKKAIEIEDALNYTEPPDWFFSVRHSLGHWLNVAGEYAQAESIYLKDLENFPSNGWALAGLYNSLKGQGKNLQAKETKKRFEKAWANSDISISSSRIY